MPLFTKCNIGLGCPQNVSVKFQAKIPHRAFIITAGKCIFWGVSKNKLMQTSCIFPPCLQKRASRLRLLLLYIYSDKQLAEATWLRAREPRCSVEMHQLTGQWSESADFSHDWHRIGDRPVSLRISRFFYCQWRRQRRHSQGKKVFITF